MYLRKIYYNQSVISVLCIFFFKDEVPKKPLAVQDLSVKDSKGRTRFHGAFTGGYSAGYFNTVGSKEGIFGFHFCYFCLT